ncbi:MAG: hypothetical protein HY453_00235, partial [Parcubacteria group bacterium]|nr:hypothetical protein [Parcubacteria group bacterium]
MSRANFNIEEINTEVDLIIQNELFCLERDVIKGLILERTYNFIHESLILKKPYPKVTSYFSLLFDNTETQRKIISFISYNIFLFDLLDDIIDKMKLNDYKCLDNLYLKILGSPFLRQGKKIKVEKEISKYFGGIDEVLNRWVWKARIWKPLIRNQLIKILEEYYVFEIENCCKMQIIAGESRLLYKEKMSQKIFQNNDYLAQEIHQLRSICNKVNVENFSACQIVANTPLAAIFYFLLIEWVQSHPNYISLDDLKEIKKI